MAVSRRVDVLHVMNSLPEKFKESVGTSLFSSVSLLCIQSVLLELKATSVGLSQLTFWRPTPSLSSKPLMMETMLDSETSVHLNHLMQLWAQEDIIKFLYYDRLDCCSDTCLFQLSVLLYYA
jgi:hypothetical protein